MPSKYIFMMKDLNKTWAGGKQVIKNGSLSFIDGAKIGVLGINGAGKSTLLKIMAGLDKEFSGEVWAAEGIRVGYLSQEPVLEDSLNVIENVKTGLSHITKLLKEFEEISLKFSDVSSDDEIKKLLDEQSELQTKIDAADAWELDRHVEIAMNALRCPPSENKVTNLSGGEKRRIALCRLLLSKPDMLLLDEPTNHLDAESVAWLERTLAEFKGTVVAITHDRYFLDNVAGWILEIDRGNLIPFEGNYSSWLDYKTNRMSQESKEEKSIKRTLERELEWVKQNPKARQSKSQARVNAYENLLSEALSREKGPSPQQITIPIGDRLGNVIIKVNNIKKSYEEKLLIEDLSFNVPPGAIVGIVGPNGAGKTTLFNMIIKNEDVDEGKIIIGETVNLGYIDQNRDLLNNDNSVWEEISSGSEKISLGKITVQSRAYVSWFNFKGGDQQKIVGQLSGGERNRVHLAKMLKKGANVLLLDEPTNDLDVDTLRALEDALNSFPGCVMVTSHDRYFLDRICTHILAFEGSSHVEWFNGNYDLYEQDKKRRLGQESDLPHRIKYKSIN
ncbi:MAG: Energy-dependent translational throttle protein EttA [Alphaproteobacteria bacterium MarineAlpha9_Bin2]|nr:MAG: Energy-dependent translational throttle protein EttA [Alphaproteobacteria bacterium MarineAlpha9_Bin2]